MLKPIFALHMSHTTVCHVLSINDKRIDAVCVLTNHRELFVMQDTKNR